MIKSSARHLNNFYSLATYLGTLLTKNTRTYFMVGSGWWWLVNLQTRDDDKLSHPTSTLPQCKRLETNLWIDLIRAGRSGLAPALESCVLKRKWTVINLWRDYNDLNNKCWANFSTTAIWCLLRCGAEMWWWWWQFSVGQVVSVPQTSPPGGAVQSSNSW